MSIHTLDSSGANVRTEGDSKPFVHAERSTSQTFTDATEANMSFNVDVENNVGAALHNTASNADRFYATRDGLWHATGWHIWNTTGWSNTIQTYSRIWHYNSAGTKLGSYGQSSWVAYHSNGYAPNLPSGQSTGYVNMTEGDYLVYRVYYKYWPGGSTHPTAATSGSNGYNGFQMRYVGTV